MAQIKHIAIRTRDIDNTAAFYKEAFGLEQVGLGKNGVYLTDGHLNVAILKYDTGQNGEPMRLGIDHIGQVAEPVRRGHSRGQLELDKCGQRQKRKALTAHCLLGRIGDRLGRRCVRVQPHHG